MLQWMISQRSANAESSAQWVATCLLGASAGQKVESGNFMNQSYVLDRRLEMRIPPNCELMQVDLNLAGGIGRSPASILVSAISLAGAQPER
jgi:hypothetical protein